MSKANSECEFSLALTQLVPRLSRYARVLTHSQTDADDLLQATLERALIKQHQWREGTQLDRWVFTIQSSIWKNNLRAQSTRHVNEDQCVDDLIEPNRTNDPQRTFLLQQVLRQVMVLPEVQRVPVLLVYVEGFSYQESADILALPIGTLMSRLARARTQLASHFQASTVKTENRYPGFADWVKS